MPVMSGHSGNEIYCLGLKRLAPGELVLGNSVYSMGVLGGIGAGLRSIVGGEVEQITSVIHDGRLQALERMTAEAAEMHGYGITGITSELKPFHGNVEFLTVGSCVHQADETGAARGTKGNVPFTTSANGQELYCQMDAGYVPVKFVFGNVAYSIGVGGGILGGLKTMARGEIKQYSDVLNKTRHLALGRMIKEAKQAKANAVVGIETTVKPFQGVHEMVMTGTAARCAKLPAEHAAEPVSSDLTAEELWNLTSMGYAPLKLVMGTAVYSLGWSGGIATWLQSFSKGEIADLTSLIYDAREHAIGLIKDEAEAIGADDVMGITTHIHEMGSLIEFMAIGTAVRKLPGAATMSQALPTQAIMRDRETWFSQGDESLTLNADGAKKEGTGGAIEVVFKILEMFGK
jgi:uncharacterized protein YbjQ (UPF0145 family)